MRAIARVNVMNGGQAFAAGDEFEYQGTPEQAEQDVASGVIEIKRVPANFVKTDGPTLAELRADADRLGIKYNAKTTKAQLTELLEKATIVIAVEDAELQPNGEIVVTEEGVAKLGEPTDSTDSESNSTDSKSGEQEAERKRDGDVIVTEFGTTRLEKGSELEAAARRLGKSRPFNPEDDGA